VHAAAPPLEGFAAFWDAYPRKKSKGQAEKEWKALKPAGDVQQAILAALDVQARSQDWRKGGGQFIPYPASWLRGKGWEDEDAVLRARPVHVPSGAYNWMQACQREHGGACNGSKSRHDARTQTEAGHKASA
jgi:hypothetical protein